MEFFESLIPVGIVLLCIAGVVALIGMAYLFFTLTHSLKETMDKVNPLVDECKDLIESTKPAIDRFDPLMERVTLTVDAANLEIMRVDQILEDVNTITGNVSKATESLDTITSLPLDAISNVTGRLKERIAPLNKNTGTRMDAVVNTVDSTLDCVNDKVVGAQAKNEVKRAERDEAVSARVAADAQTSEMSSNLKDAVSVQINQDSEPVKNL